MKEYRLAEHFLVVCCKIVFDIDEIDAASERERDTHTFRLNRVSEHNFTSKITRFRFIVNIF